MQIIIAILLMFTTGAFAVDNSFPCKIVKWPYSQNISKMNLNSFSTAQRQFLYYYFYAEIISENKQKTSGLAPQLYYYLVKTEQNENYRLYLQSLAWITDLESKHPKLLSTKELCSLHSKVVVIKP